MKKKRPADVNELAFQIVKESTEEKPAEDLQTLAKEKKTAAVALGHLGGLKDGRARANNLSSRRRREIARKAARTRWEKP